MSPSHYGADGQRLEEAIRELARVLTREESVESTISKICELATESVPSADFSGISLVEGGEIKTIGATDRIVNEIDQIQYATGEGPCLAAIKDQETFQIDDLEADEKWPRFSREAAGRGIKSLLCFVLKIETTSLAALNLYARRARAFSAEDRRLGHVFAAQAAAALANAQTHARDEEKVKQLEVGMRSREIVGKAIGILMARESLSEDEAFGMLRTLSQNLNVKLREVAADVVDDASSRAHRRDH